MGILLKEYEIVTKPAFEVFPDVRQLIVLRNTRYAEVAIPKAFQLPSLSLLRGRLARTGLTIIEQENKGMPSRTKLLSNYR
jgi:hypothetical protein